MGLFDGYLICTDCDGTLTSEEKQISDKNIEAINYFQKEGGLELDFLLQHKDECLPLECKARNGNAKSLQTVLKHPERYHISHAIKSGDYNVGRNGPLLTIPHYLIFLLNRI